MQTYDDAHWRRRFGKGASPHGDQSLGSVAHGVEDGGALSCTQGYVQPAAKDPIDMMEQLSEHHQPNVDGL